jgi:hypothetical protein
MKNAVRQLWRTRLWRVIFDALRQAPVNGVVCVGLGSADRWVFRVLEQPDDGTSTELMGAPALSLERVAPAHAGPTR